MCIIVLGPLGAKEGDSIEEHTCSPDRLSYPLLYTQAGDGARLMMLVHHDDDKREYAYGPKSKIGMFSDALLAQAKKNSWSVISMKNDWKRIFAFEK